MRKATRLQVAGRDSDPVASAVQDLSKFLNQISLSFELTNGNVEKELKLLVAAALRGVANTERPRYLSVRDKRLNGADVDLLALTQTDHGKWSEPAFWAEFKCNFREAGATAVFSTATEALAQAWRYSEKLVERDWAELKKFPKLADELRGFRQQLLGRPIYIVHFLNSKPAVECGLPEVIMKKFPKSDHPVTPRKLETYYCSEVTLENQRDKNLKKSAADIECAIKMKGQLDASSIIHVIAQPQLYAVVTRYRAPADRRDLVPIAALRRVRRRRAGVTG